MAELPTPPYGRAMRRAGLLPFAATLCAVAIFSVMDATIKGASLVLGAYSVLFWRSLASVALSVPAWLMRGARWPAAHALKLHVLRAVVASMMSLTFFWGLERLPMAEAIAISFISPLLALYLAAVFLKERIRRGAIFASLLGVAGVVVIASGRLDASAWGDDAAQGIVAVLISATLYAWNLILQRRQAQIASPLEVASFTSVVVALTLLPAAPVLAVVPREGWLVVAIIASAALAVVAGMLFSWAYARAEAQALVPLEYSAFVWAALLGYLVFGETLTLPTALGAVLVIVACWIAAPRKHTEQSAL